MNDQEIQRLINRIESHPAHNHRVFRVLAHERPDTEKLTAWLSRMAQFCNHAREVFTMAEHLEGHGLKEQASIVRLIEESEREHGLMYARMSMKLTGAAIRVPTTDTPAIHELRRIFVARAYEDYDSVFYSLGAYLALEVMAEYHIIPGQIDAFIRSGHYGVSLNDEALRYLRKHHEEFNADVIHALRIRSALRIVPANTSATPLVEKGAAEFMDALEDFYDELTEIIVNA